MARIPTADFAGHQDFLSGPVALHLGGGECTRRYSNGSSKLSPRSKVTCSTREVVRSLSSVAMGAAMAALSHAGMATPAARNSGTCAGAKGLLMYSPWTRSQPRVRSNCTVAGAFHALGDHRQAHVVRQLDGRFDNGGVGVPLMGVVMKPRSIFS